MGFWKKCFGKNDHGAAIINSKLTIHNTDETAHADIRQDIADTIAAAQKWLSAVETLADLTTPADTDKTYLCRVVSENNVYQWAAGDTQWRLYSENTDYIDEDELDDAISAHNTSASAHADIRQDITTKISHHNTDSDSHEDIRLMFQGLASNATVTDRISAHNLSPSAHTPIQDKISEEITAHNTDAAAHNVDLGTPITNDAIMEGVNSTKAILTRHNNNLKYCFNSFGTKNYMHNFLIRSGDSCIAFTISTAGTAPITTASALLKTLKSYGVFEIANKQITATGHIVDGGYTCAVTLAGEGRNPILSCYLIATDGGDSSVYLDFSSAIIMDTVI